MNFIHSITEVLLEIIPKIARNQRVSFKSYVLFFLRILSDRLWNNNELN